MLRFANLFPVAGTVRHADQHFPGLHELL